MEDLRSLESNIIKRLDEIRNKDKKTLNELEEYKSLQEDLRMVHNVMRMTEINNELELNKLSEEVNNMSEEELIEDVVTLMKEENIEVCEDVDCVNVSKLMDKNEQLQGRIDKAIEYVEKNWITYEDTKIIHYGELNIEINDIQDLFQILKGDSNE